MSEEINGDSYKYYVKKELQKDFKKLCEKNSLDFYGCTVTLTSHLVMRKIMDRTVTFKEAWDAAFDNVKGHSGATAAFTAMTIAQYSPRGEEFKNWCKNNKVVGVAWDERVSKKK